MSKGFLYDTGDELITREDVNEVPDSSTAHAGDVLELDSNKKPKWSTPESELPDTTGASVGDVLSLDEDKDPVWSTPSSGKEQKLINVVLNKGATNIKAYFREIGSNTNLSISEVYELIENYNVIFVSYDTGCIPIEKIELSSNTYNVYLTKFLYIASDVLYVNRTTSQSRSGTDTSVDILVSTFDSYTLTPVT